MKKLAAAISLTAALACSTDKVSGPSNTTEEPPPITVPLAGRLAFVSTREGAPHIYLAKPDGTDVRRLTNSMQSEFAPAWSPDGARLAFSSDGGNTYVINGDGSNLIRLTTDGDSHSWSPDGKRLLISTETGLRIVAADGSTQNETAVELDTNAFAGPFYGFELPVSGARWSPDGSRIAFEAWISGPDFNRAFVANIDGSNGRTFLSLGNLIWDECGPEWSPDGSRIALLSQIHGITVVDMATGTATPIVNSGGRCGDGSDNKVAWSPDGGSLAFTKRDPPWAQGQPVLPQTSSIVIVDLQTRMIRSEIPDAYDPAWSRK